MGLVSQAFDEATLESLKGHVAIGHTRYSTTGASTWHNAQPTFRPTANGSIALAHNGNLANTQELARRVDELPTVAGELDSPSKQSNHVNPTNDTSLVTTRLAGDADRTIEQSALELLPTVRGAFSFVFMDEHAVYAARDP